MQSPVFHTARYKMMNAYAKSELRRICKEKGCTGVYGVNISFSCHINDNISAIMATGTCIKTDQDLQLEHANEGQGRKLPPYDSNNENETNA